MTFNSSLVCALIGGLLAAKSLASAETTDITYYVSPSGEDGWIGKVAEPNSTKSDGPFATLEHARNAARKHGPHERVTILLRTGIYDLPSTLKLGTEDSGLTIAAAPGERPIVRGGAVIGDFEPYKGEILKADVAAQGFKGIYFRQLFCDGQRQILARYPNFDPKDPVGGGWAYADGKPVDIYQAIPGESRRTLHYKEGDVHHWAHPEDAEVFVFARYNWWNNLIGVNSVDSDARMITLKSDASYAIRPGDRYYIRNVLEELDSPGEWYLDKRDWTLYFWPPKPLKAQSVYAPRLDSILQISAASHIKIRGLGFEGCEGSAIELNDCKDCLIAGNTIHNVDDHATSGYSAVGVRGGKNCGVAGNDIYEVGGSAIDLSGGDRKTLTPAGHYADNNYIHHVGVFWKQGVGIGLNGVGLCASHNLIHDGPRFGIAFSGNNLVIEYNEIRDVCLETEDTGAIYTGGRDWISSRGTVVRDNFFHDIFGFGRNAAGHWETPHFAWGVYLDDNTGGVDVVNNIIARCPRALMHLHNGRDNHIENNILIDGGSKQFECNGWTGTSTMWKAHLPTMIKGYEMVKGEPAWKSMRGMEIDPRNAVLPDGKIMTGDVFLRNIVLYHDPKAMLFRVAKVPYDHYRSDENCIWHFGQPLVVDLGNRIVDGDTWATWKTMGFESHSIVADPMFVDAEHDDYHLKPDSPALKLGFQPIPVEKIGPYQSQLRASWPIVQAPGMRERYEKVR